MNELEKLTNEQLKDIIRKYNLKNHIKGYSKMKKADLISSIKKHIKPEDQNIEKKSKYDFIKRLNEIEDALSDIRSSYPVRGQGNQGKMGTRHRTALLNKYSKLTSEYKEITNKNYPIPIVTKINKNTIRKYREESNKEYEQLRKQRLNIIEQPLTGGRKKVKGAIID